ncbi:hypothetical protein GGR55DRAFT_13755 [Xylaria sp. FL0064]|nr:hypothetical protein GGR55DRAFT_13755 [Xylaria sp. FL0064]
MLVFRRLYSSLLARLTLLCLRLPRASCNLSQATALVAKDREADYQQLVESGPAAAGVRERQVSRRSSGGIEGLVRVI